MPIEGEVVSKYGHRNISLKGASTEHNGWDIRASVGTPIKTIWSGTVLYAGKARGYGNMVLISHGKINGKIVTSEYGHISSWNVKQGQKVKQGEIVVLSGNEGVSEGPHLHITIREGAYKGIAVDPVKYIKN